MKQFPQLSRAFTLTFLSTTICTDFGLFNVTDTELISMSQNEKEQKWGEKKHEKTELFSIQQTQNSFQCNRH